jgi:hypothetical protein
MPAMPGMALSTDMERETTGITMSSAMPAKASHATYRWNVARRITVYPFVSKTYLTTNLHIVAYATRLVVR